MKTKIYNYVYKYVQEYKYEDDDFNTIHRILSCYRKSLAYTEWFLNHPYCDFRIKFLGWAKHITPQELEKEFNSHEIIELMLEH